ncbi:MAG: tRNA (guanosine(37)-N1)-methyltransferase TrmD [Candidatus Berkelbacteria bacterium]|nr:MAG: tRNA (guanosine(37)-N1)-methyltransferase TrmD [Candidatus Berkelbacteria bacterium]QQG52011.1 MAG: tRNA (guanosine(37)-N1)-methyltransferase TrmD [Candidatus Berkelbacteria bacterium]
MKVDVLTLFPDLIEQVLTHSIPGRAQRSGVVDLNAHQLRTWAIDKRGTVDDSPYGGGPGMVLRVDVAHAALEGVDHGHRAHRIMLSPDGEQFTQEIAEKLSHEKRLVLLCGRYEGFDARIEKYVDQKLSIGPYVISGGELAAAVVIDAVTRLLSGVLGNAASLESETFVEGQTDFPQYTRPEVYKGKKVPEVLLGGHHAEIQKWRDTQRRQV